MFRNYDSRSSRFGANDPLPGYLSDPQTLNRYVYAGNDPINMVDPLGLEGAENSWQTHDIFAKCLLDSNGNCTGGSGGGGCALDGFLTPCGITSSLAWMGAAGRCPNNYCPPGLFLRDWGVMGEGGRKGVFFQERYLAQLVLNCFGASIRDYACYWSPNSLQFVDWDVALENDFLHCAGCPERFAQASMTADRLAIATPMVPVMVVGTGELILVLPAALDVLQSLALNPATWECAADILGGIMPTPPPATPCGAVGLGLGWVLTH